MRKCTLWVASVVSLLLYSIPDYAATDPWYENNPSCVIARGNPGRTGEYIATPILKKPEVLWKQHSTGNYRMVCYQNLMFSQDQGIYNMDTGKFSWTELTQNIGYKDKLYGVSNDAKYKGLVSHTPGSSQLTHLFTVESVYSQPLAYNDVMFFSGENYVYAYDVKAMKLLWKFNTYSPASTHSENSPLSTDGERIYVSNWEQKLYALDINTGKPVWMYKGVSTYSDMINVRDNKLFISSNSKIYVIDAKTGRLIWEKPLGRIINLLAVNKDIIVASDIDEHTHGLSVESGKALWKVKCQTAVRPVIVKNVFYTICGDDWLMAFNVNTGKKLWEVEIPDSYDVHFYAQITPYEDKLFVVGKYRNFIAFKSVN